MGEGAEGYWEWEKRAECVEGDRVKESGVCGGGRGERERSVRGFGRILRVRRCFHT